MSGGWGTVPGTPGADRIDPTSAEPAPDPAAPPPPPEAEDLEPGRGLRARLASSRFIGDFLEARLRARPIPDAIGTVSDPALRYEALNRRINAGYAEFANRFQEIVDPGFAATGSSDVYPVWFAFAPYASRQVGRGLHAAGLAAAGLDALGGRGGGGGAGGGAAPREGAAASFLDRVSGLGSSARAAGFLDGIRELVGSRLDRERQIGAFLLRLAPWEGLARPMIGAGMLDPRTAAISTARLVAPASGSWRS